MSNNQDTEQLKDNIVLIDDIITMINNSIQNQPDDKINIDNIIAKLKHLKNTSTSSAKSTETTKCSASYDIKTQYVPSEVFSPNKMETHTEAYANLAFDKITNPDDSAKIINVGSQIVPSSKTN